MLTIGHRTVYFYNFDTLNRVYALYVRVGGESRLVNWANLRMIRLRRELSVRVRACFIFQMRC